MLRWLNAIWIVLMLSGNYKTKPEEIQLFLLFQAATFWIVYV